MRHFKISEWSWLRHEFHRLFRGNMSIVDLHDGFSSWINGYLTIDITVLDKKLKNMYPEDYPNMSIKEIIIKHYGIQAMSLIESAL